MRQNVRQFAGGIAPLLKVGTLRSQLLDTPIRHLVWEGLGLALCTAVGAFEVAFANLLLLTDIPQAGRTHYLATAPQLLRFTRNLVTHKA